MAAAFGRLCVETPNAAMALGCILAAAFGRLCVETVLCFWAMVFIWQPPSGGCVLKHGNAATYTQDDIAAAFGRLYVETFP